MAIDVTMLVALVLAALAAVMTARLLQAVVALALTSAVLAIVMFRLHAPIAAVFELSICAGLVPAIFLSTIGMTQRLTPEALSERRKQRLRSYWALPLIVLLAGVGLSQMPIPMNPGVAVAPPAGDVRYVLWNVRHMDILGQIIILMGGALGVVILIKESRHD